MLSRIVDVLVFDWLFLPKGEPFGEAVHFFIFDSIIILFLLVFITMVMGVVNAYLPIEKLKMKLESRKLYGFDNFMASVIGAITPFCSCSSIPLFIGFLKGGIPLGVTLSFLITSPLVNEIAFVLLWGMFGIKVALIYAISGIILGTLLGFIFGKLKFEKFLDPWVKNQIGTESSKNSISTDNPKDVLKFVVKDAINTSKGLIKYIFVGVFIGAGIHGYVPAEFFENYLGKDNLFAVPIATVIAIPMYTNATGILPIIQGLVSKGIPIGTALAFMMAVVGLSLPEALMLKKVMKMKLIVFYFSSVGLSIVLLGYLYNLVL